MVPLLLGLSAVVLAALGFFVVGRWSAIALCLAPFLTFYLMAGDVDAPRWAVAASSSVIYLVAVAGGVTLRRSRDSS